MGIINEDGFVETSKMSAEQAVGAIIASMNANNREYNKAINGLAEVVKGHSTDINEHGDVISDCVSSIGELWTKADKLSHRKAGKLGLILVVAAGIAYVVKNEREKQQMRMDILGLGKRKYGLDNELESEGEALDPAI